MIQDRDERGMAVNGARSQVSAADRLTRSHPNSTLPMRTRKRLDAASALTPVMGKFTKEHPLSPANQAEPLASTEIG
jgi:hypothetical protein